jgi:hypothetical protein
MWKMASMREVRAETTDMRHANRPRALWILAALLAVVLAACARPATTGVPAADGRQYAQCMRDNGVPSFPDPGPDGQFAISHGEGGIDQDDPTFRAAAEKCRALAPGGEHRNTGDPTYVDQMREYSQCMRANGLPDFPDPDAEGRLRGLGHEAQGDPKFQAASAACRGKLPGGGEH